MRRIALLALMMTALACNASTSSAPAIGQVTMVASGIGFPEGTVLTHDTLHFVDYQASTVNRLTRNGYSVVADLPGCGANGLVPVGDTLFVACYDSGVVQEISLSGKTLRQFDHGTAGEPLLRPNDLIADVAGGVYFTASGDELRLGKVFYLPPGGNVPREVAHDIHNANGVALSPDGHTLYVGESATDRILHYAVRRDGTLESRSTFAELDALAPRGQSFRHTPDGIRIDRAGHLFVALYNGGGVWVLSDQGRLLQSVSLPGEHHSNLALSGDGQTMYVTALSGTSGQIYHLPNPVASKSPGP